MPPNHVTLALVQHACETSVARNLDRAVDRIAQAADGGANIVCLAELFSAPYPCQTEDHRRFDLAEPLDGPTTARLSTAAAEHGVVVIGSIFERRAPGLFHNSAVVLDADGRLAGVYRKMHIPDDPNYYEKFYFTPGDLGFNSFPTRFGRVGVCICWDQWFPEAARLTALTGAEFLFYPTAIGWLHEEKSTFGPSQHASWELIMRSHAVANGLFVAATNRCGIEQGIEFWGASFIADPTGAVLAHGSHDSEELVTATCDRQQIEATRTHWPFLRDRRIDAYEGLCQRFLDTEA